MTTGAQDVMTNDNNKGLNDGEDETTSNYLKIKRNDSYRGSHAIFDC